MKKLTLIGITLSLLLGFALWQQKHSVAAKAAPPFATFMVTNTNDSGPGSLRQAILDANANSGADIIDATGVTGTITINPANYFLVITDDVTINGPGQANLTISGGNASRIFWIQNGTITIQNLTLADGYAKGGNGGGGGMGAGGAIFMHEGRQDPNTATGVLSGNINLTLVNVTLRDNAAQGGIGGFGNGGGGGMGGNGSGPGNPDLNGLYGGAGGVLGNAVSWEYGGSVTDATLSARGANGGIDIFGSGGKYGSSAVGFGGGGSASSGGGFAGGGQNAQDGGGSGGRGGFGGGGGGASTDNGYLNNGGRRGGFGGGGGGLANRCTSCSPSQGGDDGQGGFGGGNGTNTGGGGMGAGGAIFVASGALTMRNVSFQNNTATGGTGGNNGQGLGGAIFIFNKTDNGGIAAPGTTNDPQVSGCNVTYSGNAASTSNNNVYGSVGSATGCSELSIDNVTQNEGNSGTSLFTFTVSLSAPAGSGGVTFDIATQNNSATTANNDYVQKSLTSQTILPGNSTYTFSVTVNGDTAVESNETFYVNVTNVTGASVADDQGVGAITNDDSAGVTIVQSGGGTNVTEGGATDTYTIALNTQPSSNVTISFNTGSQLQALGSITFTPANWNVAQTITVTAFDDNVVEGAHTGAISHTATSSDLNYNGISIANVTVNITDNDSSTGFTFTGFFQPVDNPPIINTATAGQAIPVKFSLGGYRGMDIFVTGYPLTRTIPCSSANPTDTIEVTVTAGGSSLSYNATTDQYTYVWKTDKAWKGQCRKLVVMFNGDSLPHEALFKFK